MPEKRSLSLSRRGFLATTGQGMIGMALLANESFVGCMLRPRTTPVVPTEPESAAYRTFSSEEWQIAQALQHHLVPDEPGAPGAASANLTGYLDAVLATPEVDSEHATIVKDGLKGIERLSFKSFGRSFAELSESEREKLLRDFEETDLGEESLTLTLTYSLEGYLGDPIYGGNPDGIVWKWLEHTPGSPQPKLPYTAKMKEI